MTQFYKNFSALCTKNKVAECNVLVKVGLPKCRRTTWAKGGGVSSESARKVAEYFGVAVSDMLSADLTGEFDVSSFRPSVLEVELIKAWRRMDDGDRAVAAALFGKYGFQMPEAEG